jgi:hypothetical protein
VSRSLARRAADLKVRLSHLQDLSSKVEEASNLERLRQDLNRHVDKLQPQLQKQAVLQAHDISVALPAGVVKMARRADGLLEKFKSEPSAATLKKGQTWRTLLDELDGAASELSQAVQATWRRSRASFFAGDTPATLRGRLARTADNDRALEQYRTLHQELDAAFNAAPTDPAAIDQVKRLAKQLEAAAHAFNFDVPEAVKAFLEAVQSVAGASLDLLTPEVVDWLKTNHSFDTYRISARSRA